MENPTPPPSKASDEIDLIELIRHIWNGRWLIVKVTLAFMVLGLVIAFTSTEQFKAEARLLPEIRDTRGGASALLRQFGGLGGLGNLSMAGAEGMDAIRPDLYPDVLKSTPFFIGLMEHTINVNIDGRMEEITVFRYVDEQMTSTFWDGVIKYTIKLPWTVMGLIRGTEEEDITADLDTHIPQMSKAQYEAIKTLRDLIKAGIDQKSGIITVSAEFPDRRVAAQIAQYAVGYLTEYITEYRIQKAQKDLVFVEHRHNEKKQDFHNAQLTLARFRDANRNIISAAAQTEEQRLQDQYNLAFNVYNGLAQQLEQSRIKVQEETPVITILEPVGVPVERSKPRRGMVITVFTMLGVLLAVSFVIGKNFYIKHMKPNFFIGL
jgi:uncharacterized protein involved in exopolysaccharide biosynthesis